MVGRVRYNPYGTVRYEDGTLPTDKRFTGEQVDGATGLQYLRARYYDPAIGRFLGRDPLPFVNRYAYVGNNPANYVDPYGLLGWGDVKKVGGAIVEGTKKAAEVAAPYVVDCASWGLVGFAATGQLAGAAAGCATGVGARLWEEYVSSDPVSQCLIWGAGGIAVGGIAGASKLASGGFGCFGGALSWLDANHGEDSASTQCAAWAVAGLLAATGNNPFRLGKLACPL
jgi:RHS repeat-associated protein